MATSPIYSWPEPDNTDLVKNGALAIRTLGNAIDTTMATMTPKSLVDAKGDLITATANDTPARLAVGNNGETLVADSSTSTGLRYQGSMAGGKNIFLNSDFSVWQRGTSFTNPANAAYTTDRWFMYYDGSGATRTISQQTFTGDNPSGCNASYYLRWAQTVAGTGGSIANALYSKIEDVRKFNGQTVTISFWAKADASRTITLQTYQEFGTGGSGAVLANSSSFSATTSWTRFSATFAMPSVTGKTIASNSSISVILGFPLNAVGTFDVTGFQLELGSVATSFQTATGTIQGELAACQRYYQTSWGSNNTIGAGGGCVSVFAINTTEMYGAATFRVEMRTNPTVTIYDDANTAGTISIPGTANGLSATAGRINRTGFAYVSGSGYTANKQATGQYKAEAEL